MSGGFRDIRRDVEKRGLLVNVNTSNSYKHLDSIRIEANDFKSVHDFVYLGSIC